MKAWFIILAMVATAMVAAYPAQADRERWGGSGRGPGYVADIAETPGLHLTAEQSGKIVALREDHLKDVMPLVEELNEKSRLLRELWLAHHPDQRRIEILQAEALMVRGRLTERIETYSREVYQILSPEQRAKVQLRDRGQGMGRTGGATDGGRMGGARREKGWMPDRRKGY